MQANGVPHNWQGWATIVRRALADSLPVPTEELLLIRSMEGQIVRPLAPPPDLTPRIGAVLVLFYPDGSDLRLLLTVRSDRLSNHRGEVSLPGGAADNDDLNLPATALRELYEELGVDPKLVTIWGSLTSIYITPSNFQITPVVGFIATLPDLFPNSDEVSAVITVTLRDLLDPITMIIEPWTLRGHELLVPFFAIAGHKVWGATALMLSELVVRIRRTLNRQSLDEGGSNDNR
ncbi:MAG: CoA pyrophosphatase [Roseiflexaceae bacterium]|nr:CoA pyrophosphatase [Roseiflexaceae bacterium]